MNSILQSNKNAKIIFLSIWTKNSYVNDHIFSYFISYKYLKRSWIVRFAIDTKQVRVPFLWIEMFIDLKYISISYKYILNICINGEPKYLLTIHLIIY